MADNNFIYTLKLKMDEYVHAVYKSAKNFPADEIFNTTSQLKRSSLSVILNFIEGYARQKILVKKNFWEISYGSLKESKYLIFFSYKENFLQFNEYKKLIKKADEIGAMLWSCIQSLG